MASSVLWILTWAILLCCLSQVQSGRLTYDEGNVGDEFYSQSNYNYDAAEDTRLQSNTGYEGNVGDEFYSQSNYNYDAAEGTRLQSNTGYVYPGEVVHGDVSLAGLDMGEMATDDEKPPKAPPKAPKAPKAPKVPKSPPPPKAPKAPKAPKVPKSPPPPKAPKAPKVPKSPPPPKFSPPPKSDPPPESNPPPKSGGCGSGNPIDDCWRCDPDWASHRQNLASCAAGFGRSAIGGKNGKIYVVTSPEDDPANPAPGTLRYGTTRDEPLWIMFESSMTIYLKLELFITSFKTIDGRGVTVHIAGGAGLKINKVSNIIVHNIAVHDIKVTGPGTIMMSQNMVQKRNKCDGDAVTVYGAKNIWIDHCYFANAADGLVDVTKASDGVTISNCYFTNHDKVMLFGASPKDSFDKDMHVTVAYNVFGPNCVQRMPRVRFGYAHVVNNFYPVGWKQYAVGGSEGPTILSQGNIYNALNSGKQVSKRINDGGSTMGGPENWNWKSEGDEFQSMAYWAGTPMKWSDESYTKTISCSARPASMVPAMTKDAGPISCKAGSRC